MQYIPYSINCSRTRIYPGTTKIFLTINVNTGLHSCELLTPLPLGGISLASTRTQSTRLQSHDLSTLLPGGAILLAINVNTDTSNDWSMPQQDTIHWLQFHELSMPLPLWAILLAIIVNTDTSNNWLMPQPGHDPHGENPMAYQCLN